MGVSVFDLFGELDLKTGRFTESVASADEKLAGLQGQIDKTEKAAVRFGGVSATTSRSFEKLSEKIATQRDRLGQSTKAFVDGEISAKSYAAALASVEKQAASANSRLKDMRAGISDSTAASTRAAAAAGEHSLSSFVQPSGRITGLGPIFRAAGAQKYGIDESILSALNVARTAAGISTAALATVGGVAVAGAAVVAITEKMKTTAEARLTTEIAITGAYNRQIAGIKEMFTSYEKFKQLVASGGKFDSNVGQLINTGSTSGLQDALNKVDVNNKATIDKISALQKEQLQNEQLLEGAKNLKTHSGGPIFDPYTESQKQLDIASRSSRLEKNKADLESLNQELSQGQDQYRKLAEAIKTVGENQDKAFDKRGEDWVKGQAESAKKAREALEKSQKDAREEIDKTIRKLDQLEKTGIAAIQNLAGKLGSDNSIAAAMLKASEATEKLKTDLAGLPSSIVAAQLAIQNKLNLADTFKAKLGSQLEAHDLRRQAQEFREGTPDEIRSRIRSQIGNSTNPDVLRQIQQSLDVEGTREKARIAEALQILSQARTPEEQAVADKSIISLGQSVDLRKLAPDQRELIAQAFGRVADREDALEKQARQAVIDMRQDVRVIKEFYDKQKTDAKSGTKVDIFLKDDTSDKKSTNATVATEGDVAQTYDVGFFNGRNY